MAKKKRKKKIKIKRRKKKLKKKKRKSLRIKKKLKSRKIKTSLPKELIFKVTKKWANTAYVDKNKYEKKI